MLILLDNADGPDQVRPLLPGAPGCLTLVISRNRLTGLVAVDGAYPLALDLLTVEESCQLLTARLGGGRAIALSVFDSDCAFATAAGPSGGAVEFYLNEEIVRALVDDNDRFEPLNSQAAAGLLTWAEKAGLVASPDRLATALEESPGPFGGGILKFTEALGIPELPG